MLISNQYKRIYKKLDDKFNIILILLGISKIIEIHEMGVQKCRIFWSIGFLKYRNTYLDTVFVYILMFVACIERNFSYFI